MSVYSGATTHKSITVSAQFLEPGQGGIGRVARLTVKALQGSYNVSALAVEDRARHCIGGVRVRPFNGSRWRFVLANTFNIVAQRSLIYDFPGTARAHRLIFPFSTHYAVWIHGFEVWDRTTLRSDYVSVVKNAQLVLVNSSYTLTRAQEVLGPLHQARVCWLGTEDDHEPPHIRAQGPPTLLFVGRSDELFAKGQDILIEIWPTIVSQIPNARLVFVGGGNRLTHLQELARTSQATRNIDVLGFVPEAEMHAIWHRATAFAMLSFVEGFGLVFVEAMRQGLPVIASTEDASCEINVNGVTGWNIARKDRATLIDRVAFLLRNEECARAFGRAALERWRSSFRFSAFSQRLNTAIAPWLQNSDKRTG